MTKLLTIFFVSTSAIACAMDVHRDPEYYKQLEEIERKENIISFEYGEVTRREQRIVESLIKLEKEVKDNQKHADQIMEKLIEKEQEHEKSQKRLEDELKKIMGQIESLSVPEQKTLKHGACN